jgi:uncharacterized protein (TIGR02391 family)
MARKEDNVEREQIIAESPRRSYEIIRLARLKYFDNPHNFLDIRLFQRGYGDEGEEVYHPTKKGVQFREDLFQSLIGKWTLVPSLLFHPLIIEKAWPSITRNEFDIAVFLAFRTVEIRVRDVGGYPPELMGTTLMRKAFDTDSGSLTNKDLPKAEQEAVSHLFAGAIGLYKNPHSHREVNINFKEAFEMLLLSSHLLNIVDRLEGILKHRSHKSGDKISS